MTLEVSGLEQNNQPIAAGEVLDDELATAQAVPELDAAISGSIGAREALRGEVAAEAYPSIPEHAVRFLESRCTAEQLPFALQEAAQLDPALLEDPVVAEFELEDCISAAEIAARTERVEQRQDENATQRQELADAQAEGEQLDTTINGLRERISGNLTGDNKLGQLDQLLADVRGAEGFSAAERTAALRQLQMIRSTLVSMGQVVTNPQERAAFEQILSVSSLNLGESGNYAVFSDVMARIDASDAISEETKIRLRVEALGIPPFRDSSELLGTLEQVRVNDGRFRNADGQVVEFNARNGVPVGRYTVYPDPNDGSEYVATTTVGGRTLTLPFDANDDPSLLDEQMSAVMVAQVLANRDLQAANQFVLGGDGLSAQGIGRIRLDEFQVARAERLYGAFMGFGTELRTGFPRQSDLVEFERRLQATHIDGDAKTNDNTGRGDLSWREIGLIDEYGNVDMNKVEEVGAYVNQAPLALRQYDELVRRFSPEQPNQ